MAQQPGLSPQKHGPPFVIFAVDLYQELAKDKEVKIWNPDNI